MEKVLNWKYLKVKGVRVQEINGDYIFRKYFRGIGNIDIKVVRNNLYKSSMFICKEYILNIIVAKVNWSDKWIFASINWSGDSCNGEYDCYEEAVFEAYNWLMDKMIYKYRFYKDNDYGNYRWRKRKEENIWEATIEDKTYADIYKKDNDKEDEWRMYIQYAKYYCYELFKCKFKANKDNLLKIADRIIREYKMFDYIGFSKNIEEWEVYANKRYYKMEFDIKYRNTGKYKENYYNKRDEYVNECVKAVSKNKIFNYRNKYRKTVKKM